MPEALAGLGLAFSWLGGNCFGVSSIGVDELGASCSVVFVSEAVVPDGLASSDLSVVD